MALEIATSLEKNGSKESKIRDRKPAEEGERRSRSYNYP